MVMDVSCISCKTSELYVMETGMVSSRRLSRLTYVFVLFVCYQVSVSYSQDSQTSSSNTEQMGYIALVATATVCSLAGCLCCVGIGVCCYQKCYVQGCVI
ncbi:hypothetical protein CHS0354_001740 [Potamilus streckersoni]|uniref:Uncharacterized protein n=1 Tax=Potamilus streckersoni TaxID=2493646 RepID=A0AAE0T2Z6_9BIVA|nr:hypothetical protein CHS0354_001740 [Potamilus streckersoni]